MTSNEPKLRKIDYGSPRRMAFGKMITDIYNEIPEIETRARSDLANIQESLWYSAPEALDIILQRVFHFLQTTAIFNTADTPPWLGNIRRIWTAALSEDGTYTPEPPSTSDGS